MLEHRLILPEGILLLEPDEPLEAMDFESVIAEMPELIGHLIDVDVKHFPDSAYDDATIWLEESTS